MISVDFVEILHVYQSHWAWFFCIWTKFSIPKSKKVISKKHVFWPFFRLWGGHYPLGFNFLNFHLAFLKSGNINLSEKVSVKSLLGLGEWVSTNRIGLQLGLQKNGFECPVSSCPWYWLKSIKWFRTYIKALKSRHGLWLVLWKVLFRIPT